VTTGRGDAIPVRAVLTRPTVSIDAAAGILRRHWGIRGDLTVLPGERDRNFRVDVGGRPRFVLKVANLGEDPAFLELQNRVMTHVAGLQAICQRPVPATDGRLVLDGGEAAGPPLVRLLTWLPGVPLADVPVRARPSRLHLELGIMVGRLSSLIQRAGVKPPDRAFQWDVLRHENVIDAHVDAVADAGRRALLDTARQRLQATLRPVIDELPRSLIHNDANDHNVLVDPERQSVTGFLDFGDMVHSPTVNEAAVAAAYAALGAEDPVAVIATVAAGFEQIHALGPAEQAALFELVIARLATSVALSAHQARLDPSDPYLSVSEEPAWGLLERLMSIRPATGTAAIVEAGR
jgi:hypothetical protein